MINKKNIFLTALTLGTLWALTMSIVVSVVLSFISGFPLKPNILIVISLGGIAGIAILGSMKYRCYHDMQRMMQKALCLLQHQNKQGL